MKTHTLSEAAIRAADYGKILPNPVPRFNRQSFSPTEISTLYQQALAFHRDNRFDEAESLYRQILDVMPNHPGALHFRGMVRFARDDPAEAVRLIEQSLCFCNTKAVYFNNYGVVLNEQKRYPAAKKAFEEALILDPNYPDAYSNLGLVSVLLGESGHVAEHHFHSALRLQPNHRDALRHSVDFLFKDERYEESLPFL